MDEREKLIDGPHGYAEGRYKVQEEKQKWRLASEEEKKTAAQPKT